jgi:hypothetical protein
MIREKIEADVRIAQKAGEKLKLETLRLLKSDIRYKEIEKGQTLSDDDLVAVLSTAAKRRRESIAEFKKGGRADLVAKEEAELGFILGYLPQQLSPEELKDLAARAIEEVGAKTQSDVGKVMKVLMPQVHGKADGKTVNACVQALLEATPNPST